ncbi:MAG: hypothetical protein WAN65_30660 [Candidatus Sulfotelmatobacter sp.]
MKKAVLYLPYYAACIALASALWRDPFFLLSGYIGLSAIMLWRWHSVQDLIFFAVPFFLGPTGEAIAIYHGAWQYAKPLILVPMWLPFAWGCAALYMKKTSDALAEQCIRRANHEIAARIALSAQVTSSSIVGELGPTAS